MLVHVHLLNLAYGKKLNSNLLSIAGIKAIGDVRKSVHAVISAPVPIMCYNHKMEHIDEIRQAYLVNQVA